MGFVEMLDGYFKMTERKTTLKTEFLAATATFMTLCYILAVNSRLLSESGGYCMRLLAGGRRAVRLRLPLRGRRRVRDLPGGLPPPAHHRHRAELVHRLTVLRAFPSCAPARLCCAPALPLLHDSRYLGYQ